MAVRSQSQENQVETRELVSLQAEGLSQRMLILLCRRGGLFRFRSYAEHVFWNRNKGKHRFVCHTVIAVSVIRRDVALVAEEEARFSPGNGSSWLTGEQRVQRFGGRSAR